MMGEDNQNPNLPLHTWDRYPIGVGRRSTAEAYARRHVTTKPVLWAPCQVCLTVKDPVLNEQGVPCTETCCVGQPMDAFNSVWGNASRASEVGRAGHCEAALDEGPER